MLQLLTMVASAATGWHACAALQRHALHHHRNGMHCASMQVCSLYW
jgi:hypothetical protein